MLMLTSPYSIYIDKRPIRVAFLLDDGPKAFQILERIFKYNRERWGGRYNPVVLTNGRSLASPWLSLLVAVDPDVVKSTVALERNLVELLDRKISPHLIEPPARSEEREGEYYLHLQGKGLEILPTHQNVRAAGWVGGSKLVLFETHWQRTDTAVKQFVEWNFGSYSPMTTVTERALAGVDTKRFSITDIASLSDALTQLSTYESFTYPIQICAVPNVALSDVEHSRFGETFLVVVGDSVTDVAHFWNHPLSVPRWSRTHLKQLWLPVALATNEAFIPALASWLQHAADPGGNMQQSIRFVSRSLPQARLAEIVEPIAQPLRMFKDIAAISEPEVPTLRATTGLPRLGPRMGLASMDLPSMDLYRVSGTKERITLNEPKAAEGLVGEYWMADVYMEFRPERHPTITGRDLWWQLPRRNILPQRMFGRAARVQRDRYPSVLMKRGEPYLDIQLPDDLSIFCMLVAAWEGSYYYSADARASVSRPSFGGVRRSEKGRYLSGLIELFGGLHPAASVLEQRYWRRMFDILSGRKPGSDAEIVKGVMNKLKKLLNANPGTFYGRDESLSWLARVVFQLAQHIPEPREVPFSVFEGEAEKELADFNAGRESDHQWSFSRDELTGAVGDLTASNVLLMGVRVRCPSCGYRAWYSIDEAKQTLKCHGCGYSFPTPSEPVWHYRLNSLVQAGYGQHGLAPVVLILGEMLMWATSSFIFAPSLDVFEREAEQPFGDLDIVAIVDGKFVIGEIKQSRDLFDQTVFDKMLEIAKRVRPDELLFASMDSEPNKLIEENIHRISVELEPYDVHVKWQRLQESILKPHPVQ